jgi:hypothetical protein
MDQHILSVCKFRLIGNDEAVSLSLVEPFYTTADPD